MELWKPQGLWALYFFYFLIGVNERTQAVYAGAEIINDQCLQSAVNIYCLNWSKFKCEEGNYKQSTK